MMMELQENLIESLVKGKLNEQQIKEKLLSKILDKTSVEIDKFLVDCQEQIENKLKLTIDNAFQEYITQVSSLETNTFLGKFIMTIQKILLKHWSTELLKNIIYLQCFNLFKSTLTTNIKELLPTKKIK